MSNPGEIAFNEGDPNAPAVQRLISDYFRSSPQTVDLTVAQHDDMFHYSVIVCGERSIGIMAYFRAGLSIYDFVSDLVRWRFGSFGAINSFLDFASGHGRFTRFLVSAMLPERVWASEILSDAVRFQQQQFRVNAIQSTSDPDQFQCEKKFDCIFVSSLFTHLPGRTFRRWLKRLYDQLSPGGILVYSVHDEDRLPEGASMPSDGIYFLPSTEIASLDVNEYGATIVTDRYVVDAIRSVTDVPHVRIRKALGFVQDVYIISNQALPKGEFVYDYGPQGCVDTCYWTGPQHLHLSGWAADIFPGHTIQQIHISINGKLCGTASISTDREDIPIHLHDPKNKTFLRSGWNCAVRTPEPIRPFEDVLAVNAVCSGGKHYALRTVPICTILQFPNGVQPTLSVGDRLTNAIAYLKKGEWGMLREKTMNALKGK